VPLFLYELRHRPARFDARSRRLPLALGKADEAAPGELFEGSLPLKATEPRNSFPTARDHYVSSLLDLFQVFAETVMELTHPYLSFGTK